MRSRILFLIFGPPLLSWVVWRNSRDADILNPHNFPALWVASAVGKLRGIPIIWTCNEPPTRLSIADARVVGYADYLGWLLASSRLDQVIARRVSMIHVLSERTQAEVSDRYARDSMIIRSGVDLNLFGGGRSGRAISKLGLNDKFVMLTVGKLHPQKNQSLAIRILADVREQIPDTVLVVVGEGPTRKELERLAQELDVSNSIRFLGRVSTDELADIYAACALNLFTATNQSWGLTPFEALAAKKVSIVSSESGAAEIVKQARIGIVANPTAEDFSAAAICFAREKARFRHMAERGHQYVRRHLSHEAFGDRFHYLICQISSGSDRPDSSREMLYSTRHTT